MPPLLGGNVRGLELIPNPLPVDSLEENTLRSEE
jgi:hypothetical protein